MNNKSFFITFLLLTLYCGLCFANPEPFPVYFTSQAKIKIDGGFGDWPRVLPFIIDSDTQLKRGKRADYDDFHAVIFCFLDSGNLYLRAEINDKHPLMNKKTGTNIWQGDCIEGYIGFREEEAYSYGDGDFQYGIALTPDNQQTWIWGGIDVSMKNFEAVVLKTEKGAALEAKIPVSNFGLSSVSATTPLWIDFAVNNSDDGAARLQQLVWNGDGEGWSDPSVWRKAYLTDNMAEFKKPSFISKTTIEPKKNHRLYIYNNAQPWKGTFTIDGDEYTTDESGGASLRFDEETRMELEATIGGKLIKQPFVVEVDRSRILVQLPVKRIKVNQIGYHPKEKKIFIVKTDGLTLTSKSFEVVNKATNSPVFKGEISGTKFDNPTKENIAYGDFSPVRLTGTFFIRMEGIEPSYDFEIKNDVFADIFYTTFRSYYLQRCGIKIEDKISGITYGPCHKDDGYLKETGKKIDVKGGWHDAGDYGKYIPTAGVTVTQILLLYEKFPDRFEHFNLDIPESGNDKPDILDELMYELDWMLKMQAPDGGVYHKVNTYKFPGTKLPEADTDKRLVYEVGTNDTGIFCGTVATAARVLKSIYPSYAQKCEKAALKAGEFLLAHEAQTVTPSNDYTGAYLSSDSDDEQYWAFAELFRLTADRKYLEAANRHMKKSWVPAIGWENTLTLGIYTLLKSGNLPQKQKENLLILFVKEADSIIKKSELNGYRAALYFSEYSWASNKTALAYALNLLLAYDFFYEKEYLEVARRQLDYILGFNVLSKCFITGMGDDPVKYPHHRIVQASKVIVPGLMMGGPNDEAQDGKYPKDLGPRGYVDNWAAYSCNEYAIDYNAPLVFLAGYFMCLKDKGLLE
ncbi:MAG: glycoside hydrolase family 9 protein [Spirochaetales bacterium]|nr:glycoside hydrolase family 9 protein [Spirochaetales bacterium]